MDFKIALAVITGFEFLSRRVHCLLVPFSMLYGGWGQRRLDNLSLVLIT